MGDKIIDQLIKECTDMQWKCVIGNFTNLFT